MRELNVSSRLSRVEYSKTVEAMLVSGEFREAYVDTYLLVEFVDKPDFTNTLNLFIEKKYSAEVINYIYQLNKTNFELLKSVDYVELSKFVGISNIDIKNIDRYYEYQSKNNLDLQTSVTRVNLNIDLPFYSQVKYIDNPTSYQVLINKYNRLPSNYVPNDLVSLDGYENQSLRKIAAENLIMMIQDAKVVGCNFEPFSTYRSESYQDKLYNNYVLNDGVDAADTYSARSGHSEHQSGLAVDLRSVGELSNLNDRDINWILSSAHNYGFILRYLEETSFITGYTYEPWHLRYVGQDIAVDIVNKNITFDEYYDLYLKDAI